MADLTDPSSDDTIDLPQSQFALGWAHNEEDWDYLSIPTARSFSAPRDFVPPPSMSFRGILRVWNQLRLGSCVGHGGSSGLSALAFLSDGEKVDFSRMFMYIQAQIASGIRGDNGAAISGAIKAMINVGCCFESEDPYTGQYTTRITQAELDSAKTKKILGHQELNSGAEVFDWISQGKGPVIFGFNVTPNYENLRGKTPITPAILSGRNLGGHCNLWCGYTGDKDSAGNFMIDGINSWADSWGDGGWAQWTQAAIDTVARNERGQSSIFGITDITGFSKERIDRVVAWNSGM